jgi:hypothetical protein
MIIVGSRAHRLGGIGSADRWSDWDFQIVTSQPKQFRTRDWTHEAGLSLPISYVERTGRLGHTAKISAVFAEGDLDLVLIPARRLLVLKWLLAVGIAGRVPRAQHALNDLSLVLRAGHHFVKSSRKWEKFFCRVISNGSPPWINDDEICVMANGFVCDYLSTRQKILRGEYLAAQRWLHINLGEANFRLLHELNLRSGGATFHDGRRIEATAQHQWRDAIAIDASPNRESLFAALEKSAQTCRALMEALVGQKWTWPDLSLRLR